MMTYSVVAHASLAHSRSARPVNIDQVGKSTTLPSQRQIHARTDPV